jgi:hypothetical protein
MDETIGRDTLLELIKLQIKVLKAYKDLLESWERREAKEAINDVVKAAIKAAGPVLRFQKEAYERVVDLHEGAVVQTGELLKKLLEEEEGRASLHKDIRERTQGSHSES